MSKNNHHYNFRYKYLGKYWNNYKNNCDCKHPYNFHHNSLHKNHHIHKSKNVHNYQNNYLYIPNHNKFQVLLSLSQKKRMAKRIKLLLQQKAMLS